MHLQKENPMKIIEQFFFIFIALFAAKQRILFCVYKYCMVNMQPHVCNKCTYTYTVLFKMKKKERKTEEKKKEQMKINI